MRSAFICDAVRTPIGRYGGALSQVRTDDLAAIPIRELIKRYPRVDWNALDDVLLGCANQAGEDNRNVARMALLLAGLPETCPGGDYKSALRIRHGCSRYGGASYSVWGSGICDCRGVESMSRAPFVMGKAESAFQRSAEIL